MRNRNAVIGALIGACLAAPALAQVVKPAESTSKVKKVLRYTKWSGYLHDLGQRDLLAVLNTLRTEKGFELVNQASDAALTADYLKQFQVIIWDNNVDAGASVPSTSARTAILDYVNNGGGWVMVHGAGDHRDSWPAYRDALATTFSDHGAQGPADLVMDQQGLTHPELKYMMDGWPATVRFTKDEWYSFKNTVRGKPNTFVIATAKNGATGVLNPVRDGSNDHTYVFARFLGTGRLLYTALGHGGNDFYNQASGFAAKAFWENMRFAAGDYINGCTVVGNANYDANARVLDQTKCAPSTGLAGTGHIKDHLVISRGNMKVNVAFTHAETFTVKVRDVKGAKVWEKTLPAGTTEIALDQGIKGGVYFVEARSGRNVANQRILLP